MNLFLLHSAVLLYPPPLLLRLQIVPMAMAFERAACTTEKMSHEWVYVFVVSLAFDGVASVVVSCQMRQMSTLCVRVLDRTFFVVAC